MPALQCVFIPLPSREKDLDNLIFMYNVIMNYICKFDPVPQFLQSRRPGSADTLTELFLEGAVAVPIYLLVEIEIDVLKHLLLAMTQHQQMTIKATDRHESPNPLTLTHL